MKVDDFIQKRFHPKLYNCTHFSAEVWLALTGQDLRERLHSVLNAVISDRKAISPLALGFKRLAKPIDPCIVIMQSPVVTPHVAIFVRGKVLQIHELGVEFSPLPIAMRGFKRVKFYA